MTFIRAFVVMILGAAIFAAPASAAPCWQEVIDDWFEDSRVDGTYPIHCYKDALKNLPEDMRAYSSAPDDIARAMRAELARKSTGGGSSEPEQGESGALPSGGSGGGNGGVQPGTEPVPGSPEEGDERAPSTGLFPAALDEIGPNDASSIPLPLIVLGAIALLLVAGGVAGLITRRIQAGRPPPSRPEPQ